MALMRMRETLSFDDVLLEPRYSDIESRKEISLTTKIGTSLINLPIMAAPMDTVVGVEMAIAVATVGGLPIFHRYNPPAEQIEMLVEAAREVGFSNLGAAIGVNGDYLDRASALYDNGARILCIDVAHGHHLKVKGALKELRWTFGEEVHIMAGNVATLEAFNALADWGADSIRVGIGGGSICSTRTQTGHGIPTFQSVLDCSQSDRNAILIADGGIKNSGDMVKAYAAGADFVMIGSLLAGTDQAPTERIRVDGKIYKTYRGMASKQAQNEWRGKVSSIEGVSVMIPQKGDAKEVLEELRVGIRSGLSYSGARNIAELQAKARFIGQTAAGQTESSTHIKRAS